MKRRCLDSNIEKKVEA